MNFLSFLKDSDAALHAVYLISGRFVTGMLVNVDGDKKTIKFAETRPLSIEDHTSLKLRTVGAIKTLNDLILNVQASTKDIPTHVDLFLGAPWSNSLIRTHTSNYDKPHPYTHQLERSVLDDALQQFRAGSDYSDVKLHLVQSGVVGVSLNGYSLPDPYGKKAEEITLQLWLTLVHTDFYRQVINVLGKQYHRPARVHSLEEVLVAGLGTIADTKQKTAYVLFGSEYTHIVLEDRSRQRYVVQIKYGFDDWYRLLQTEFKKSYIQARSLISLYDRNQLEDSMRIKVEHTLQQGVHDWFLAVRKEIMLSHEFFIPLIKEADHVFILTKELFGPMIKDFLITDPAKEIFSASLNVTAINDTSFQDRVSVSGISLSTAAVTVAATIH